MEPPAGRPIPARPHALCRRARRGICLWRYLCRECVRLGGDGARPVRHHSHPGRHDWRGPRWRARRSLRVEARDLLGARGIHSRIDWGSLGRQHSCLVHASRRAQGLRECVFQLDRGASLSRLRHSDRNRLWDDPSRQARTLLAKLSPPEKTTEFFGFFSFSGKITAFTAPLAIGAVTALTGSQRLGIGTSLVFLLRRLGNAAMGKRP